MVVDANEEVITPIKVNSGGHLIYTPTIAGGNINTGPVTIRLFASRNREAVCSQILGTEDQENYRILLGQLNVSSSLCVRVLIQLRSLICLDSGNTVMIPWCILHFTLLGSG